MTRPEGDDAAAALQRLLDEELPTGQFGDGPAVGAPRPVAPRPPREVPPDPNAAAHRAQLLRALTERPASQPEPGRHLRAVPDTHAATPPAA